MRVYYTIVSKLLVSSHFWKPCHFFTYNKYTCECAANESLGQPHLVILSNLIHISIYTTASPTLLFAEVSPISSQESSILGFWETMREYPILNHISHLSACVRLQACPKAMGLRKTFPILFIQQFLSTNFPRSVLAFVTSSKKHWAKASSYQLIWKHGKVMTLLAK